MNLTCMQWTSVSTAFKTRVCEQDLTDKECCAISHIKWPGCVHTSLVYFSTKLTVPQMNLFFRFWQKIEKIFREWVSAGNENLVVNLARRMSVYDITDFVTRLTMCFMFCDQICLFGMYTCSFYLKHWHMVDSPWFVLSQTNVCLCSQTHKQKLAKSKRLSISLTTPGQRCHRKCCSVHLDLAGQTHCARYWGATHILGLSTPFWLLGTRSTSFVGSSVLPSHSAHREDNGCMYEKNAFILSHLIWQSHKPPHPQLNANTYCMYL